MSNTENHKAQKKQMSPRLRNTILNTLGIIAIIGVVFWCISYFGYFNRNEITNDASVEEYINPVNSRIGGYIKEIRFNEHQRVKKGDTLVIIDDRELKIAVDQAEAACIEAKAGLGVTERSLNTASNSTTVADANIAELQARLINAETNYKRYSNLLQEESVSQQQFEQAKVEYDAIKAKYQSLLHQKQSTQLVTGEVRSKLNVNEAAIKRATAALDMARLNLSYAVILAPYDGYTGRRALQEGQLIQPGQTLVSLIRSGEKWIVANFRETQASKLHEGQKVNIKIDALDDKIFSGYIGAMSQATGSRYSMIPTDNSAGNFVKVQQRIPVRIEFDTHSTSDLDMLRAGMNAVVEVKRN